MIERENDVKRRHGEHGEQRMNSAALSERFPASSRAMRLLSLSVALSSILLGTPVMAKSFQPVSRLTCPDGDFIVDARPYAENEAGSSAVEMRYRYKGIELATFAYEGLYARFMHYLRQNNPPIYNFGLRLNTSGKNAYGGEYETGPTLYLPPSAFSAAETERLAACIAERHDVIRSDFERAVVISSTFLGLMKTRAHIGFSGIARLVHAEAPIVGSYGGGWFLIMIERGGRVLLQDLSSREPEAVVWGQVESRPDGARVIRAKQRILFAGKEREGVHYLLETDHRGRRLKDDYVVVFE
ncbi:hypothetical protein [Pseudomonas aeruginosa]|uniref:hypothetical protein n=1 Tax=Pseudomonas aeruginosa TaxID=287 RepID=UPI0021F1E650|nr:hypothetical protein [Pseudomonas aeruginosa]MCV6433193.1 hypothetical protein [Pseudomonas aeruginosa]MCV6440823.1 hypothetical protein [Pseudomonas aeruginosa]HBP1105777.1 hypothetical protein [Pseudomonas aeruginosa]HCE7043633.1 hypothetical protein [Pseudomonas aeruginosa]HCE7539288.1 hypothetical protein [Pseudomonas aeruginosa]